MNVTLDRWAWAVGRAIAESGFTDTIFKEPKTKGKTMRKECTHVREMFHGAITPCLVPDCEDSLVTKGDLAVLIAEVKRLNEKYKGQSLKKFRRGLEREIAQDKNKKTKERK
jgi:hypothetical protein